MLKARNIKIDKSHKAIMRCGELLVFVVNFLKFFLPFGILTCLSHPMEPTHGILKD